MFYIHLTLTEMPKEYNRKKKRKFKAMLYGNNKLTKQLARVSDRLMDLIYLLPPENRQPVHFKY